MMPLKTCCLCCKLETGAYVLCGFGFVGCLLNILMGSLVLSGDLNIQFPESAIVFQLVWGIVMLIIYLLLLVGTKKRNSCLILPFLIIDFVGILLNSIGYILYLIKVPSLEGETLVVSICIPLAIALAIYIWMCMYSLYMRIKNARHYNKNEYV